MSSFASIGGLASGLDTNGIVQQLLQLERLPLRALSQRQQQWRAVDTAWGGVLTKLSAVRSSVDALRDPAALERAVTVTSSSSTVASATRIGTPAVGVTELRVDALAAAHRTTLGGSFAAGTDGVGPGSVTLRRPDGSVLGTVTLGAEATLADAARQLDALDGVRARIVRTEGTEHRLVVTADRTGAGAAFAVETDVAALTGTQVLTQGADAELSLGDLRVTRSTNVITDLLDGVELRLGGVGDVRIDVDRDLDAGVELVRSLVDAVNGALTELGKVGATSQTAGSRGPLASDPLVRSLALQLRGVISSITGEGTYATPSSIGVSLTRDGKLTFDEDVLRAALDADPSAVGRLVGRASSASDSRVGIVGIGQAPVGTYQLQLDVAATVATVTGAAYTPPGGDPKTFRVTTADGRAIEVALSTADSSVALAVQRINQALEHSGVRAVADGDAIHLEATRAGSGGTFSVEDVDGAMGFGAVTPGQDASGTLSDGTQTWTLTGSGQTLTGPSGTAIAGLALRVPLGATGGLGTITVADGLAGAFDRILRAAEGSEGSIARARDRVQANVAATDRSIVAFERRLELRERTLRAQFTAMESALARLSSQGNWLASQLASMQSTS